MTAKREIFYRYPNGGLIYIMRPNKFGSIALGYISIKKNPKGSGYLWEMYTTQDKNPLEFGISSTEDAAVHAGKEKAEEYFT